MQRRDKQPGGEMWIPTAVGALRPRQRARWFLTWSLTLALLSLFLVGCGGGQGTPTESGGGQGAPPASSDLKLGESAAVGHVQYTPTSQSSRQALVDSAGDDPVLSTVVSVKMTIEALEDADLDDQPNMVVTGSDGLEYDATTDKLQAYAMLLKAGEQRSGTVQFVLPKSVQATAVRIELLPLVDPPAAATWILE